MTFNDLRKWTGRKPPELVKAFREELAVMHYLDHIALEVVLFLWVKRGKRRMALEELEPMIQAHADACGLICDAFHIRTTLKSLCLKGPLSFSPEEGDYSLLMRPKSLAEYRQIYGEEPRGIHHVDEDGFCWAIVEVQS